jgi:hypothetical protein
MDTRKELAMAYQPAGYPPPRRRGLGIAALVLGLVSLTTLLLCGLGAAVAVAGLIVGIIAVVRNNGRGMAVTGITLSALTLVIAIGVAIWFFNRVSPCADKTRYPTKTERDHCLQSRVPFFKATPTPMR